LYHHNKTEKVKLFTVFSSILDQLYEMMKVQKRDCCM